jgi:23S rRNA (guanosine2251-2'-O)-methyltransferase
MPAIVGIHAVREALRAGRAMEEVQIQAGAERRCGDILELCRRAGVHVRHLPRAALDRVAEGAAHQGVVAVLAAHRYTDLEAVLAGLTAPGLLVALDGVEDPHNLGAIVRTAYAAGAGAVIIPERRAAGLTAAAAKAAAGALEHLPVCRVTNMARTLDQLKEQNYWVVGLEERAGKSFRDIDYRGGCVIVLGGEGGGLHHLVRQKCDFLAAIPMRGASGVSSLNVSVAAGVVLFEAQRQRAATP